MADRVVTRRTAVLQVPQNLIENKCYECTNCLELERELKNIRDEISTYQFIVELLRKEIKDIEIEKTQRTQHAPNEIETVDKNWSQVVTRASSINKRSNATKNYLQAYPAINENRYSALAYTTETSAYYEDRNQTRSSRTTRPNPNKILKEKDTARKINPTTTKHRRDINSNSPPKQIVSSEIKCDSEIYDIPTIVNGQVKQVTNNHASGVPNDIQTLLSETTVDLINKKINCTNDGKHEVRLIGDSHLKGCATRITSALDIRFKVCAFLKPGSNSQILEETIKGDIDTLTKK